MSKVDDIFDDLVDGNESYVIAGKSDKAKKFDGAPNAEGEFFGHLKDASQREVSYSKDGKNFCAIVYNYYLEVAKENKSNKYVVKGKTQKGKDYVGRSYRSKGVFRFLEPKEGDDFVSNTDGNKGYFAFCRSIGVECPTKVIQIDGQDVEVNQLPSLTEEDINGKPAIGVVKEGKPYVNKDGDKRTPYEVIFVKTWEGGKEKTDDDIPF